MDQITSSPILPIGVFVASLLGSGHCIGMCGAFTLLVGENQHGIAIYHLGRLASYLALGFLAGLFGQHFLHSSYFSVLPWFATIALSVFFLWMGIQLWRGQGIHLLFLKPASDRAFSFAFKIGNPPLRALCIGLFSVLLPCGWLYSFIVAAISLNSKWQGAIVLFAFWLGTVPALSFGPTLVSRFVLPYLKRLPRLSAVILILLALISIERKVEPLFASAQPALENQKNISCHQH